MTDLVRIQKVLAEAGVASRRAAEELVAAGRVMVNGEPAAIGDRVDAGRDRITVDGRPIDARPTPIYLAVNKPPGFTSTVSDRYAERTVLELVPDEVRTRRGRLYPVGRLDRESEGLLLLTNDGEWANRLMHPRYGVEREYAVGLSDRLDARQLRVLLDGIELEEGPARIDRMRPATAAETKRMESLVGPGPRGLVWYRAVLTQGRKRQLRRMFGWVEAPVQRLVRVRIGGLRLDDLRPGDVRELSAAEREGIGGRRGPARTHEGLLVSLDGPGSSGKSSVGAGAALQLGYRFLDTGVLYRAVTLLALRRGVDPHDAGALADLAPELELVPDDAGRLRRVRIDGEDVTEDLHSADVDREVSVVSAHPEVRSALLPVQRALAAEGRMIMAGRDIGTVVLPDADLKLYIDVSVEERARRRSAQRAVAPGSDEARAIEAELQERDRLDSTRATAPLRVPDGAVIIRSDGNTLKETVAAVVEQVRHGEGRAA